MHQRCFRAIRLDVVVWQILVVSESSYQEQEYGYYLYLKLME